MKRKGANMYSEELAKHFEQYRKYEQETFIKGGHNYCMLKSEKETIIYDNEIQIFKYGEQHTEFLEVLPLFTDELENLEAKLKELYDFANSPNYDCTISKNKLIDISKYLQEKHIFFCLTDNSLLFIRRVLYEYFCKMVEYRFILYLEKTALKNDLTPTLQDLESFREQDKEFLTKLFLPLYQLLYQDGTTKESSINRHVNHLWNYFLYGSHCFNALNAKIKESELKNSLYKDNINFVKSRASSTPILWEFKIISDTFSDYFSVLSDMRSAYPQSKSFHQYALLISNNYFYQNIINSCTFYSSHQSMHKMINHHIRKMKPNNVAYMDTVAKDFTDNIYQHIKDSIDADDNAKAEVIQELKEYYPNELEKNIGTEIIEFQYFEQLFSIELLDIIAANKIIKRCHRTRCNCFFIADFQNRKYCDLHKNNHRYYQQEYIENLAPCEKIYNTYESCLYKRIKRGKLARDNFDEWKKEVDNLISHTNPKDISQNEFIAELNSLCKKYGISIPRKYNKNQK